MKVIEGKLDFFYICDNSREATDLRDDLRGAGIYSIIDPNSKEWTVVVAKTSIIENFKKEFVRKYQ